MKLKRALISVYDKTGIVEFARALVDEFSIEILSTGGTARLLKESGIAVTLVEDITGWGEMLDGRVKTLHPRIHAAILADRDNPAHMRQLADAGIEPIDMVVVNLYPFEKTVADPDCQFEDAIEMIDIGGPCMLRAAAKNHRHVIPVSQQKWYPGILGLLRGESSIPKAQLRIDLAAIAFELASGYNAAINVFLDDASHELSDAGWKDREEPTLEQAMWSEEGPSAWHTASWGDPRRLRYGENPHQRAIFLPSAYDQYPYGLSERGAGAEISFNNIVDASAAISLCHELQRGFVEDRAHCVFIKHTNACGVGIDDQPLEAYRRAYLGDPNAAMGGILACSFPIDPVFADNVMHSLDRWGRAAGTGAFFAEVWLAPAFDDGAINVIRESKSWGQRVRLMPLPPETPSDLADHTELTSVAGGFVRQSADASGLNEDQWRVVTDRRPSGQELADLRLAWLVCKHTKSNAISICKDGMLIGNGAGQMSRVMSCRIATWLAQENGHAEKLAGSAAASDAFFPFRDGPDILADAGVTAIIQPGGSKRDADTIAACNARNLAMIFTGTRHFKH